MTRDEIERELLAWMRERPHESDAARFEALALALFRVQFDACEPYAAYCRAIGRCPEDVTRSDEIPAVPTGAFKEFTLRGFPAEQTRQVFRTSGTSLDRRGELHLDRTDLYEASLLASLRRHLLVELVGRRIPMRFLAPSLEASPDSSLGYMFETLRRAEGGPASGFDLKDGRLDVEALASAIAEARRAATPMLIAGTAFAFVHLLDAEPSAPASGAEDGRWTLPPGSRVMETGGFKSRSREVPREILRRDVARLFGLDEARVVNQYGMTELASQFYDSTLSDPAGPRRKLAPPWARVRIVEPDSLQEVAPGEVGLIVIHDLANTGSVAAIQTADLGRAIVDAERRPIGFDVLGRGEGAEARGCSIATDAMLAARDETTDAAERGVAR